MDYSEFRVNFKDFDRPRPIGVSGILRMMNDEEFLESSIESCVNCLDELIVVYNETSPESLGIINRMKCKYPDKIRVYKYLPKLYNGNLSQEEFDAAKKLPPDSIHLLANYYNYALSKCRYRYVMKIDSDQIYYTEKLQIIVERYRSMQTNASCKFIDCFAFLLFLFYAVCLLKLHIPPFVALSKWSDKLFSGYFKVVLHLIQKYKIPVSLSGFNLYIPPPRKKLSCVERESKDIYIPLGKNLSNSRAISSPFNGIGDHPIFKMCSDTYFVPYICPEYDKSNGRQRSIIERLYNVKNLLPVGVCWAHFSSNRSCNSEDQQGKFKSYPNYFLNLKKIEKVNNAIHDQIFRYSGAWDAYQQKYYHLVSFSINESFITWLSFFMLDRQGKIRHIIE